MATTLELANFSNVVYDLMPWETWKIKEEINNLTGWDIFTENSGFKAALYEKGKERVVAFAGTEEEMGDYGNDLQIITMMMPNQAAEAIYFFNKFYDSEYKTTITGHSLGGALAAIVANNYPLKIEKAVTFNSPGTLGLSYFDPIEERRKDATLNSDAAGLISHYLIYYDGISMYGNHLGKEFWAGEVKGYWNHRMKQWFENRYNADGNYDPGKEINKIVFKAEDFQRPKRLAGA